MKLLKTILIAIMTVSLIASPVYAGHLGGGEGHGNGNNGNGNKGKNNSAKANRAAKSVERRSAARNNEIQRNRDQKNNRENRPDVGRGHLKNGRNSEKSGNAKWWKHPSDDRGQGNNGKPKMLNPYGHDKDSDRKELYGNNGRPIREDESEEEPSNEEITNIENLLSIDFSLLGDEQAEWITNWYQSVLDWYYTSETIQSYYSYEKWSSMWEFHFYPGGTGDNVTGIRVGYNDNLDYTISGNSYESDALEVTTTLIASEDFSTYNYVYNSETGSWTREIITISAGDVLSETTQEVTLDPITGDYIVSAAIDGDGVPMQQNIAYFVDMEVSVTDTSTGDTQTITYDQSLYLYRCPYGKVYNNITNVPIVNAKVTVFFENGSIVPLDKALNPTASNPQYSDATGRYGAKLQTGRKYYLEVEAEGYELYRSSIFTEKWHVLREDAPLTPLPIQTSVVIPALPGEGGALYAAPEAMSHAEIAPVMSQI